MSTTFLRFIPTLLCLTFALAGKGQNANPYYHFKQLNVQNGLVQNIAYHFLQDSRGYVWIGTRDGITLYDGIRTTNFQHSDLNNNSLRSNFITRFLEDSDHRIWIGTDAGIELFNKTGNHFIHFVIPGTDGRRENSFCVPMGFTSRNELWFIDTRSKAIRKLNTKTNTVSTVCSTDAVDGTLSYHPLSGKADVWTYLSVATTHYIFKKDVLVKKDQFFNGNTIGQPALLIFHVYHKNDSAAWLATAKGLINLNPSTGAYTIYNKLNQEPVTELRYIAESPKGILWTGSGNAGIYTFDPRTKKFIDHFRDEALDPHSLCSENIVSLYFDRVGNIWCGSYGKGVSYAHVENNFFSKHLSKAEMDRWKKENNVSWTGSDQHGNLWCLMLDVQGLWELDPSLRLKAFHWPVLENGKPFIAAVYQLLFDGPSSAWCTTDRGLFRYDIKTNKVKQINYPQISTNLFGSYWSKVILRLHDSSVLFSTFSGVYRISKKSAKESILPLAVQNMDLTGAIDMIFEDHDGHLYVKDTGDSLYVLKPSGDDGRYIKVKSLLFRPSVFQMQETDREICVATAGGLYLLKKPNLVIEYPAINTFLPSLSIKDLLVQGNKFWLFGERGLYFYDTTEHTGRLFNEEDGLPSGQFNEYTLLRSANGDCIVGTTNGLLSFDPSKTQDTIYPPRAQLINMYVNDSTTPFLETPQEYAKVNLGHDQNTFSFDFSIIGFQHADESVYEYKLDPYDENWIRSGTTHYARYSKIAPGTYQFRIRTLDANGRISPYAKTLTIDIRKAFWQTFYFKLLMFNLIVLLLWAIVKWWLGIRIRKQQIAFEKQQAIEKERTRIATDMHDDLGAGLSRIKFLSETIGMKKQMQQPIEEEIGSISNYANEMIGKMGEIVWALNEKNDSISDLLSYTRAYATEYMLSSGIECQVNAPAEFPSVFVSGEFRRNVYLTIKEALHNIVKHAGADFVEITIAVDRTLTISIRDNGSGFDTRNIRPFSNGLNNMRKRMKDIRGNLEIVQKNGTLIRLTVPVPE
jgi:signal transduction histidine kinase/ligand-binding sensor domain-containing protein